MEPETGAETVVEEPQFKLDPDIVSSPPVRPGDTSDVPIKIKKEEAEDVKLNLAAENEDIFDEVDGPEYVDLTYEGIAEVDGVEHFVCESPYSQTDAEWLWLTPR